VEEWVVAGVGVVRVAVVGKQVRAMYVGGGRLADEGGEGAIGPRTHFRPWGGQLAPRHPICLQTIGRRSNLSTIIPILITGTEIPEIWSGVK